MWLVELSGIVDKNEIDIDIVYKLFGNKYFLFSSNKLAVNTIRKLMKSKGFNETWISIDFDKNNIEYVYYLYFETKEYEVNVWFDYHIVDLLEAQIV